MTSQCRRGIRALLALAAAVVLTPMLLSGAAPDPRFEFAPFDFPDAINTEPWGINASGDIVGIYQDAAKIVHGFVFRNGVPSAIDYPGTENGPAVIRTQAEGINPQGDIVGAYKLAGEPAIVWHSFVLTRHGEFQNIDVAGWRGTVATAILPDGTIVGCVHQTNMNTTMYGFVRSPEGDVSVSSASGTMNLGATPDHRIIVGRYVDVSNGPTQHYGFILDDTGLNYFRVPGSSFTQAWGVNARGEVVGYATTSGVVRGFLKNGDDFTEIAYPGGVETYALGINSRGDIVGGVWDGTQEHAFIAKRTR